MSLVLLVEDDPAILRGLADILRFEQHDVVVAHDGESGYRAALEKKPALVILDLMLPDMSGFEVCRKLRAEGCRAPLLMLTARGEEADRVRGLDLGADDYMTKPFSVRELLARVRALLRRAQAVDEAMPVELRFDDVVVDFRSFEAARRGMPIEMTRKEFGLLRLLAARAGRAVTRDEMMNTVWGHGSPSMARTIDTHVASLRAKLEVDPAAPKRVITVHGVGYKLTIPDDAAGQQADIRHQGTGV
jgi:DNA-binding response OmpR family regulator